MSRPMTVFLPVPEEALDVLEELLEADPGTWLPDPEPAGPDTWRIQVWLGPLNRQVACEVGPPRRSPGALWRDLSWVPVAHPNDPVPVHTSLPSLTGEIGFNRSRAVLVLNGTYDVPGGRIGELADAVSMGGPARSTVSRFLADISGRASQDTPSPVGNGG